MARKKPKNGKWEKTSEPGIYRRNGVYVIRIYNPEKKSRDNHTALTFEQAKEIKASATRAKRVRRRLGGVTMTVTEWGGDGIYSKWLELFPRPRESTMLHNAERVSHYVRDFGDQPLPGVDVLGAHEWAAQNPGRVRVVKAMLNDAVKARLIEENPFNAIQRAKGKGRAGIVVLTDTELGKLVTTAHRVHGEFGEQVFGPMIEVAAGTGVRPGELFAITRDDIDFDEGEIHVWRQFNGRTRKYASIKGTALERRVVMLERAQRALERMDLPERGPIWRAVREGPFKFRELYHYWPPVRTAFVAGLGQSHHLARRARGEVPGGPLDFYELRHFFGTALARAGATPYEIAQQMGHQDGGKLAMDTYVHLAEEDARAGVKAKLRRAA